MGFLIGARDPYTGRIEVSELLFVGVSQRRENLVDMPGICRAGDGPDMRQPFPLIPFASVS